MKKIIIFLLCLILINCLETRRNKEYKELEKVYGFDCIYIYKQLKFNKKPNNLFFNFKAIKSSKELTFNICFDVLDKSSSFNSIYEQNEIISSFKGFRFEFYDEKKLLYTFENEKETNIRIGLTKFGKSGILYIFLGEDIEIKKDHNYYLKLIIPSLTDFNNDDLKPIFISGIKSKDSF